MRENGGQYTHGAIWTTMAFAVMGENDRAWELFGLLNPVHHGATPDQIATYKVEPYVVAADVYAVAPHTGRGGWTWYTGSAGWMYRLLVETLLGVNLKGDQLRITPRLPKAWTTLQNSLSIPANGLSHHHHPAGDAATGPMELSLDGQPLAAETIAMVDDHIEHFVEIQPTRRCLTTSRAKAVSRAQGIFDAADADTKILRFTRMTIRPMLGLTDAHTLAAA